MQWQEIRQHYLQQWLLLESIQSHSEVNKRTRVPDVEPDEEDRF